MLSPEPSRVGFSRRQSSRWATDPPKLLPNRGADGTPKSPLDQSNWFPGAGAVAAGFSSWHWRAPALQSCAKQDRGNARDGRRNLRLCDRRRGLGRLRAGQPAERGRQRQGGADRGGRPRPQPVDPHAGRLLPQLHQPVGHLAVRLRARAASRRPHHHLAARARARRLQRDQRPALRARPGAGLRRLAPARQRRLVLSRTCCPTSSAPRTRSAAPTSTTAPAARSAFRRAPERRTRCARPSSRPARRPAFRATTTSTAPSRRAPATSSSPTATAGAARRPSPTCARPARGRNLSIITNALVHGIELDGKRATGVRYARNGRSETASAAREVILAAGAIGSPQILQLSGIGPAAVLKAAGVAGAPRAGGRRREPAGPPAGALRLCLHRHGQPQRRVAQPLAAAADRHRVRAHAPRHPHHRRRRGRRLRALAPRCRAARHPVPLPAARAPTGRARACTRSPA